MDTDYLRELEYLGVTARIKRLSESLFYSIKEYYKYVHIDIEPSWHLVLLILKERGAVSMLELAQALNLSKPAVTKMIKKMQQMNYVTITANANDSRKKMIELSKMAKVKMPVFEKVWNAGQLAVQELLKNNEYFMESLEKLEQEYTRLSFDKRAIKIYEHE